MSQDTQDLLTPHEEEKKLPAGLNVLTILTFVGCALELYNSISGFITGKEKIEDLEKNQEKLAEAPAWVRKLAGPEVQEMMHKSVENRVPLLIIGLVAVALCVYGAMEMRKLKKQGYTLWLIGELLPYAGLVIFIGGVFFKTMFVYFTIIPIIFILLYTFQRKHLRY